MVQRKVPPKLLGLQADHPNNKFDNPRFGRILGPSSPKNQDGLTKKMKKSRSINKRNGVSLPGKPPPPPLPRPSTPEKQPPARRADSSPNYMKSTTSSDARKERSPVSPQTTTPSKKSSKSSSSGHKSTKTLTKTCSLKLGRTLTKSPSFKPARSSSKPPQVVLCDDVDVQRATCSSTLKETKFPSYLELSHGATESEGTSAMRVCPYTYCSLNGHRHAQHPPLKSFLSARRRMVKTQKSAKIGCLLSPGRARPGDGGGKEMAIKHMVLDDKPNIQEIDSPPLKQENQNGFVIEIYVRGEEDAAEEINDLTEELEGGDIVDQNITTDEDGSERENGDMEWEEGQYSAPADDDDDDDDDGQNIETDSLSGDYDCDLGKFSFDFDDISSCKFDEIPSHEGPEESSEEEERGSSESDDSFQNWGGDEDYGRSANLEFSYLETDEHSELDVSEGKSTTLAAIKQPVEEAQEDETDVLEGELEGKSTTLAAAIDEPVEEAREDEIEGLEAESECPVKAGEDGGRTDSEISHGDSAEQHNNNEIYQEDYSSSDYQFEAAAEEEEVVESSLDKVEDLEKKQALSGDDDVAMETEQDDPIELSTGVTEAELDATLANDSQAHSFDKKSHRDDIAEDQDEFELNHVSFNQNNTDNYGDEMEAEYADMSEPEEATPSSANNLISGAKTPYIRGGRKPDQEQPDFSINLRITKCVRPEEEELEDPRKFNPREPNYLPVKPDPEAEKVDLKHQMMEERKDAQEWMVDYALRQTVDRLATARKRKVALLVEAFEKVTPIPKYQQSHLRHTPAFAHTRFVQACS